MRSAGVLMPVSALPARCGIGTLGAEARAFVDFLADGAQSFWQVLPVGPTGFGDSPYQSFSTFAGNPYFIDLDDLAAAGLLEQEDYIDLAWGEDEERVDYGALYRLRPRVLRCAVERLWASRAGEVEEWRASASAWLEDYALFMAAKGRFGGAPLALWPDEVRRREPAATRALAVELADDVHFWVGVQFLFARQWERLLDHAHARGVRLIGDVPIYVAEDSADVWAHPEVFQLDDELCPVEVAGCPPDGFSATGQLWGNPLFDWDALAEQGYAWWVARIAHQFKLFDVLRIDHFRGFDSYYAIPAEDPDATRGRWRKGPGLAFFQTLEDRLGPRRIIAEDLGFLTPSVKRLLDASGYPGMKVLEFAFDRRDGGGRTYQPHRYPRNCVAYVGTHDNPTAAGWLAEAAEQDVAYAREYLALTAEEGGSWGMMRGIWASAAELAVVQMQDLLGLGASARMNTPSTIGGNWTWRMRSGAASAALAERLRYSMDLYERTPHARCCGARRREHHG